MRSLQGGLLRKGEWRWRRREEVMCLVRVGGDVFLPTWGEFDFIIYDYLSSSFHLND